MENNETALRCECTPVYGKAWSEDGPSPSEAIVEAVAVAEDVDPLELDPLYDEIDADALDTLFADPDDTNGSKRTFCFELHGWNVFVCSDGRIQVCEPPETKDFSPVFEPATSD